MNFRGNPVLADNATTGEATDIFCQFELPRGCVCFGLIQQYFHACTFPLSPQSHYTAFL